MSIGISVSLHRPPHVSISYRSWNSSYHDCRVTHLQARRCHRLRRSRSIFLRSSISSGRSILLVLSKSLAMVRLILSSISSCSRSIRACRSDLDVAPLTASRSLFLPSMASLSTYEAPTLKRMRGIPALTKRWPPGGGLLGGRAAAAAEAGRFVPAVSARELIMRCHEPTCGCRLATATQSRGFIRSMAARGSKKK